MANALGLFVKDWVNASGIQVPAEGQLLEVVHKAVVLEQSLIVREVVRHIINGVGETIDEAAPEIISVPEVDRAVHRLEAPLCEPLSRSIEKGVRSLLIINAVEEPAASCLLPIFFILIYLGSLLVIENRNPS